MNIETQQPTSPVDFDFDFDFNHGRVSPTPCTSSPSTPKGFKDFSSFSVPTSPARSSEIYHEFENFTFATTTESEFLKPTQESETIKSPLLYPQSSPAKMSLWSTFSPKRRKESKSKSKSKSKPKSNPFASTKSSKTEAKTEQERGRERVLAPSSSRSGRRETRSLSPLRVSKYPWEEEQKQMPTSSAAIVPLKGTRRWKLKDLLLFRSASEGRASEKDPFRKYADLYKRYEVGKGPVSAHELHYTVNKKVSEDMKKKSFLPYKQGILGRLAFNPTVHALAHGFGSLAHGHN